MALRHGFCGRGWEPMIDAIVRAVGGAGNVGIDCPLGWPDAFVDFVARHRGADAAPVIGSGGPMWRQQLVYRRTDLFVRERVGITPLSVAADRMAHVALRCAGLLSRLDASGIAVDRSGQGVVIEVYPKASLKRWNLLPKRSYKQSARPEAVTAVLRGLTEQSRWLDLADCAGPVSRSHDVLDALVAALTARAAFKGLTFMPGEPDQAAAKTEGWIAVPSSDLGELL